MEFLAVNEIARETSVGRILDKKKSLVVHFCELAMEH